MSNYPNESLSTWVLVNRDGEIEETECTEDCPSSTPLEDCLSSPMPLKEERETLEKYTIDQNEIIPINIENLLPSRSEVVFGPDTHVALEPEELAASDQIKSTGVTGRPPSKSNSQHSEETDETDSDLIHLSQEDVEDSSGNILELSVDFSSNSSQFSYMNGNSGTYEDSPQDDADSDVLVLDSSPESSDSSHGSLDSSQESLNNLKISVSKHSLFDAAAADSTVDDSSIPEREVIDLSHSPKIRQYKHIPNNRLNVALTILMMLSATVVLGLAIGHFLGAGRQWMAQTKKAFVSEELKIEDMVKQLPKNTVDFWRIKYKEQLRMNEHLKTLLATDSHELNLKEMSKSNQELNMLLQLEHLKILKDLQVILLDLQQKEQERKVDKKKKSISENIEDSHVEDHQIDSGAFNLQNLAKHSDELIVVSDQRDMRSHDEVMLANDNPDKETDPFFYEEASSLHLVDSEEKSSLIISVEDDNIVSDDLENSYAADTQIPIPLLPPPPPENIMNEMVKANIDDKSAAESKHQSHEFNQLKLPYFYANIDNQEILIQSLKSRILQLQQENDELRSEMTYLRNRQRNAQSAKESREHLPTSSVFQQHSLVEQVDIKNTESPNPFDNPKESPNPFDNPKKCTHDNRLFNSRTLHYFWRQFDKFTSISINEHLHNLPGSHLFNTEELVKKLNHTKNAFYTLQNNLAQKWTELYSVQNTSESFHQTVHKIKDPLLKMGNVLQQTWNKVKNISHNFFVKEESTVKRLAMKISEKLGHLESTLEKKWSELNEKLNRKLFSQGLKSQQSVGSREYDKKWNKKNKKYLNKIQSRCNQIVEKIKANPFWFDHIQGSRNPYVSEDFQVWLKEEKFFEDDEHEVKQFWKNLRKTMKYPDQKELMWLSCQYKWWQPNNIKSDICIVNEDACKSNKNLGNQDFKLNKMNSHYVKPSQENNSDKIFWVFGRAKNREKQRSTPEIRNSNWVFNRAKLRDSLRDRPDPKSEWIFKRAEDRKYQRHFHSDFEDSWKIYDWLNKRAEIRKHLRYLDGFK